MTEHVNVEKAILGCCLTDGTLCDKLITLTSGSDMFFTDIRCKKIYEAIKKMRADGLDVNITSLCNYIDVNECGGYEFLISVMDECVVPSMFNTYYTMLVTKFIRRKSLEIIRVTAENVGENNLNDSLAKILYSLIAKGEIRMRTMRDMFAVDGEHGKVGNDRTEQYTCVRNIVSAMLDQKTTVVRCRNSFAEKKFAANLIVWSSMDFKNNVYYCSLDNQTMNTFKAIKTILVKGNSMNTETAIDLPVYFVCNNSDLRLRILSDLYILQTEINNGLIIIDGIHDEKTFNDVANFASATSKRVIMITTWKEALFDVDIEIERGRFLTVYNDNKNKRTLVASAVYDETTNKITDTGV